MILSLGFMERRRNTFIIEQKECGLYSLEANWHASMIKLDFSSFLEKG